jgi:hypothetical protein
MVVAGCPVDFEPILDYTGHTARAVRKGVTSDHLLVAEKAS